MRVARISIIKCIFFICVVSSYSPFVAEAQEADGQMPTGLIFEREETLRTFPLSKVYRNYVPPKRDLTKYTPLPGSQGQNGSCVGWAIAYAARTQHFIWDNKKSRKLVQNIASPAALYNNMYYGVRNDCSTGSNMGTALDFMRDKGVPSVSDFPLNQSGQCQRVMSELHFQKAEKFKIKNWSRVYPRNGDGKDKEIMITRIRDQVSQYRPVMIAMYIPTGNFGNSSFRYNSVYNNGAIKDQESGHAVTIIGYDDNKRAFKIINSWGRKWGSQGYLWISYEALKKLVYSAYVMETRPERRNNPAPEPSPTPAPEPKIDNLKLAQQIVGGADCAGINFFEQEESKISIFAKSDGDAAKLKSELQTKLSGFSVLSEIAPWPQCEARLTLKEPISQSRGLILAINDFDKAQSEPTLFEGDPLVLKITTPDFPSYIYAAYLAADKQGKYDVVHLIQTTNVLEQYAPNSEIVIGDGRNNTDEFTIEGPNFGKEMIVLIASASPLYTEERAWVEIERDYLSGLRDALIKKAQGKGKRQVTAQFLTLTTKGKN